MLNLLPQHAKLRYVTLGNQLESPAMLILCLFSLPNPPMDSLPRTSMVLVTQRKLLPTVMAIQARKRRPKGKKDKAGHQRRYAGRRRQQLGTVRRQRERERGGGGLRARGFSLLTAADSPRDGRLVPVRRRYGPREQICLQTCAFSPEN